MPSFDVNSVFEQLTTKEKVSLLAGADFWHTASIERLGVPAVRVSDGPNGVRGTQFFNSLGGAVLPNGTGLASSFDKDLLLKAGELIGTEAHHKSVQVVLGPTANIPRGPNGGRGFESYSEDPYLSGIAAAYVVNGIQNKKVAATLKHYVGNDLEDHRYYSDNIVTERALREIYLEPFRLATKLSNPKLFMTGFNKINGTHVALSKRFLKDILQKEWNWSGAIMSDWFGSLDSKQSIEAGLDLEMPGPAQVRTQDIVTQQIGSRELHINHLDDRVKNILELVKYTIESGIPERGPEDELNNTPETAALLRTLAADSIVLLKNEGNVLPIKDGEKVAVIGPNAKTASYSGGGSASLTPYYTVTPYEGITKRAGYEPPYTVGAYAHVSLPPLGELLKNPYTGEQGYRLSFNFEPYGANVADRRKFYETDTDRSFQVFFDYYNPDLGPKTIFYADFEGLFTADETVEYEFGLTVLGTAQLFVDDKLVVDNKTDQKRDGANHFFDSVEARGKINLEKGKEYKIRVEFGSAPTFTLKQEFDNMHGAIQIGVAKVIDPKAEIARAVELAKSVDKVILTIGLNGEWESENYDRKDIQLPGYTNDLVSAVLAANPNTVVVNQSGTPVEFPWLKEAKALVQAWFGGNELGNAIADVLYGDVNPSGKLSLSFPLRIEDNPAYLNFKTERGRVLYGEDIFVGYRYYEKLQRKVAFPFGYGLSYTTFSFSDLTVATDEANNKLKVSVKVTNTGSVTGKEVVQVYISKTETDVIRPVKELKGFEKVELSAGESKVVEVELELKDSVSFFDEYENKWSVQAGEYQAQVGPSSDDIELTEAFNIEKAFFWTGL